MCNMRLIFIYLDAFKDSLIFAVVEYSELSTHASQIFWKSLKIVKTTIIIFSQYEEQPYSNKNHSKILIFLYLRMQNKNMFRTRLFWVCKNWQIITAMNLIKLKLISWMLKRLLYFVLSFKLDHDIHFSEIEASQNAIKN